MQRHSKPLVWRPKGISDTLDASDTFTGAMANLSNLIPDPSTSGVWQCRPASSLLIDMSKSGGQFNQLQFSDAFAIRFSTPPIGNISAFKVVGNFAYGMIATSRFAGKDEPFCFNLLTNQIVAVTGVTNATTPTTPVSSGAWTPPSMDVIGAKLIVCHPGFTGAGGNFFGWFDISTPSAPVWHAGNLTGLIQFTVAPSAVAQFFGRAYFIHNVVAQPAVVYSDVLNATNATNANQVLTFGDNVALTALGQQRLTSPISGGIVQSLIVFKGVTAMFQITGDAALNNLASNALYVATGTLSPLSVCSTPKGLAFVAPDGLRVVDLSANVSDPVGLDGRGVTTPFIYAVVPSRICSTCNGNILRVSVQNGNKTGSPFEEYWYDFARNIWHGPHTLPANLIQPYSNTFVTVPQSAPSALFRSDPQQNATSGFVENGVTMTWGYGTPNLPDTDEMVQHTMTEATLDMALSSTIPAIPVSALSQNNAVFDTIQINPAPGGATLWGGFTWGTAKWGGVATALAPRQLPWHLPITFTNLQIQASGQSAAAVRLGTLRMRYQSQKYLSNISANAA